MRAREMGGYFARAMAGQRTECGKQKIRADLYDQSRRTFTALTVGAYGTQKETEDDEREKNGRGERADNHEKGQ